MCYIKKHLALYCPLLSVLLRPAGVRTVDYIDYRNKQPCPPLAEVARSAGGGFLLSCVGVVTNTLVCCR